jgi:hypothetical protein
VQIADIVCLWYGSFHTQTVRVVLVRDSKPRTGDRDERGYGLPLVTTDLTSSVEDLVARYAARWCIEVAFSDARQILGVGQARNRTRAAVQHTVPFGLVCLSLTVHWYASAGHALADAADHRSPARWYTTKTEPSFDDMTIKLRRVIIAARFRPQAHHQASPGSQLEPERTGRCPQCWTRPARRRRQPDAAGRTHQLVDHAPRHDHGQWIMRKASLVNDLVAAAPRPLSTIDTVNAPAHPGAQCATIPVTEPNYLSARPAARGIT